MSRLYHREIRGPDPEYPFTVVSGFACVHGEGTITLPAGATWPGFRALPEWMGEALQPTHSELAADTTVFTERITPREIEFGVALVHSQLLRTNRQALGTRLEYLAQSIDLDVLPVVLTGALIGGSRYAITDKRRELREAQHAS